MTEEERNVTQSLLDIAVIKVQVDAILKKQDDIMVIIKDEVMRMKESYTRQVQGIEIECAKNRIERKEVCADHKKCIEEHSKKIGELEQQQEISNLKLGGIVFVMTSIFSLVANLIWDIVTKR